MELQTFLAQTPEFSNTADAERFASKWAFRRVEKGSQILGQDDPAAHEFILLDGQLTSSISNPDGHEICVGLYLGACVVTPNIARTRAGLSLVSIEATTDALVAQLDSNALTDLMISCEPIRDWANDVLRKELAQKADREWCLAALGGADRLAWFRKRFPGYEDIFTHSLIASFLGITPVTMSRLRSKDRHQ